MCIRDSLLHDLQSLIDNMLISVAQPERRSGYSCTDTSISFWSNSFATCYISKSIDPEGGVPATGFFFDTNVCKISIFATFWPIMPPRARSRLLEAYVDHTVCADIQTMVVGGSMHCNVLGAENLSSRIDAPIDFHVNGTLSLFVSKSNPQIVRSQNIRTEGLYSVLTELTSSAEPPETTSRAVLSETPRAELQEATPLWNQFIDMVSEGEELDELMNYIAHKCFFGDLLHRTEDGEWLEKPMSVSSKMERLLEICKYRRELHVSRLRSSDDPRCSPEA